MYERTTYIVIFLVVLYIYLSNETSKKKNLLGSLENVKLIYIKKKT